MNNGEIITSPKNIAKVMNQFFVKKVETLKKKIPKSMTNPTAKLEEIMKDRSSSFDLRPVTREETRDIVLSLKSSKAVGLDNIPADIYGNFLFP